jgi:hypothetical protein
MTGGRMHSATVVPPVDVEKVALARWLALNARPVMQSALDYDKLADVAPTRLREEFGKNFWLEYAEEIIAALSALGGWNEAIEAAAQIAENHRLAHAKGGPRDDAAYCFKSAEIRYQIRALRRPATGEG